MTLLERTAKKFLILKAARRLRGEIEQAGLDNLVILANAGRSIVGTYLSGCSPQKQAELRREINSLLSMGVTFDIVLDEMARQMPKLAPIIQRQDYKVKEVQKVQEFLKGG